MTRQHITNFVKYHPLRKDLIRSLPCAKLKDYPEQVKSSAIFHRDEFSQSLNVLSKQKIILRLLRNDKCGWGLEILNSFTSKHKYNLTSDLDKARPLQIVFDGSKLKRQLFQTAFIFLKTSAETIIFITSVPSFPFPVIV